MKTTNKLLIRFLGFFYRECTLENIAEKREKIFQNNKAWSTKKFSTERNTFSVKATPKPSVNDILKEMA